MWVFLLALDCAFVEAEEDGDDLRAEKVAVVHSIQIIQINANQLSHYAHNLLIDHSCTSACSATEALALPRPTPALHTPRSTSSPFRN